MPRLCLITGRGCDDGECYHGCIRMVPEQDRPRWTHVGDPTPRRSHYFVITHASLNQDGSIGLGGYFKLRDPVRISDRRHEARNFKAHWN